MTAKSNHISICICTYKRPELLANLLKTLESQRTDGLFAHSIVLVDNDDEQSAKSVVAEVAKKSLLRIDYYVEPKKNIALARNRAVKNANGGFVAFIDDDELPAKDWLYNLHKTYNAYDADGVLGPVKPCFHEEPPSWILKGRLFERPTYKTGTVMHWRNSRTGNALLSKSIFKGKENAFDPEFGIQGEDVNFFKHKNEEGYVFVWCNDAPVHEMIPPSRCKKGYFLRRAFTQGNVSLRYHKESVDFKRKAYVLLKSSMASIIYTIMLPFTYLFGTHYFMKYLIKDVHHVSRLLALFKVVVIKERNF